MKEFHQAVLKDVEVKVKERSAELMIKGKQLLDDMQRKHAESISHLTQEVQRCNARQQELEAENERLKQAVRNLSVTIGLHVSMRNGSRDVPPPPPGQPGRSTPGRPHEDSPPQFLSPTPQVVDHTLGSQVPSPLLGMPPVEAGLDLTKMPEIPAFPFAPQPPASAPTLPPPSPMAPLSLEQALAPPQTPPQRTPLSLATSLSPPGRSAEEALKASSTLNVTLRKADGAELGLFLLRSDTEPGLRVEGVRSEGAVQAWNRQCQSKEKEIVVGDRIVSVNGISDNPDVMLTECKDKQLLRLVIERATGSSGSSTLRADANVFVPKAAGSQESSAEAPPPPEKTESEPQT